MSQLDQMTTDIGYGGSTEAVGLPSAAITLNAAANCGMALACTSNSSARPSCVCVIVYSLDGSLQWECS